MKQNEIGIPILTYHSLDSSGSVISTSPEVFRRQMKHLAGSGFQVLTLRNLAGYLKDQRALPAESVVITFDDGFRNVYDVAFPVLKEYGFTATVFLVTDFCGKNNRWYGQSAGIPELDLLTWDQAAEMAEHKIEFGVHTATHPDLTKISDGNVSDEILGAKKTLQNKVAANECAFAYPYGKATSAARSVIEKNFYAACSTTMDFATAQSDLHFLPRIEMYYFSTNDNFSTIGTTAFSRYVHLRKTLRGLKRMVTGN